MTRRRPFRRLLQAVALCAVALLNVAVVKSTVMQAAMAPSADTCRGAMASMAGMTDAPSTRGKRTDADHRACGFCAAAAHAPMLSAAAAPAPASSIRWIAWTPGPGLGPRGPPALEARARGPPRPTLTLI